MNSIPKYEVASYEYYEVKNQMVTLIESGYCAGGSITDNPDDIYRIVSLTNAECFHITRSDAMTEVLELAKQYTEDCTEVRFIQRIEELNKLCTLRALDEIRDCPDGVYLDVHILDNTPVRNEDLPFPYEDVEENETESNPAGYIGTITEVLERTVFIPGATSIDDANRRLKQAYRNAEIILSAEDFVSTEIICREMEADDMNTIGELAILQ